MQMWTETTKERLNSNHYYIAKNMSQVLQLFKNVASKDKLSYPIFDDKGYMHIVLWQTNDGQYRIHNTNKINNKDRLCLDIKVPITDGCYHILKHEHFDNLYSFRSRHIGCISFYIEITDTHIKKTHVIDHSVFDIFKKTTYFRLEPALHKEPEPEEEVIKPKRKRKSNSK